MVRVALQLYQLTPRPSRDSDVEYDGATFNLLVPSGDFDAEAM
jgi:hypothetical protein